MSSLSLICVPAWFLMGVPLSSTTSRTPGESKIRTTSVLISSGVLCGVNEQWSGFCREFTHFVACELTVPLQYDAFVMTVASLPSSYEVERKYGD